MRIVLIGDVHGKTHIYQKMLRQRFADTSTIQLGDMGLGFPGVGLHRLPEQHAFIRGNHDNPDICRKNPNYLGEYGFIESNNLFYISGAASIDRAFRIEGTSWWPEEELSMDELAKAIDLYEKTKPRFVVSHECPTIANMKLLADLQGPYFYAKGNLVNSRTCTALQMMFEIHWPEAWIFGHYHVTKRFQIHETTFQCVNELDTVILDTEKGLEEITCPATIWPSNKDVDNV